MSGRKILLDGAKLQLLTFSPTMFFKAFFLMVVNLLPYKKILDLSKLRDFADDKINVRYTQELKFVLWRVEDIVKKKGEISGN